MNTTFNTWINEPHSSNSPGIGKPQLLVSPVLYEITYELIGKDVKVLSALDTYGVDRKVQYKTQVEKAIRLDISKK